MDLLVGVFIWYMQEMSQVQVVPGQLLTWWYDMGEICSSRGASRVPRHGSLCFGSRCRWGRRRLRKNSLLEQEG